MGINYRAATISIAVITIVFGAISVISSVRFDKEVFKRALKDFAVKTDNDKILSNANSISDFMDVTNKVGIAFNVVLVITAVLLFFTVNQYMTQNKEKRYFLLPYIVFNTLIGFVDIILVIVLTQKLSGLATVVATTVVIIIIGLAVKVLFVSLIAFYFRFLKNYIGY